MELYHRDLFVFKCKSAENAVTMCVSESVHSSFPPQPPLRQPSRFFGTVLVLCAKAEDLIQIKHLTQQR